MKWKMILRGIRIDDEDRGHAERSTNVIASHDNTNIKSVNMHPRLLFEAP
jgi:hypothetical protein